MLIAHSSAAQTFTKVYSAADNLFQFTDIAPLPGGGWCTSGYLRNSQGIFSTLSKFDNAGNQVWTRQLEENRDPRALVTLPDGSLLYFNNNSGFQGYFDASVVHLGADGSFIKETVWGLPEDQDDWFDAKVLANGEVIAVGMSRASSSFSERMLVTKFSTSGQVLWEKTYDGGLFTRLSDIIPLPTGDFYAIGQYFNNGSAVSLLAKFTSSGDLVWVKSYQYGTDGSYFLDGLALSNGSLFIAAYQTLQGTGDSKLTLVNIDATGAVTNQKTLENNYDLAPIKLSKRNDDTLLIAAVSSGQVFPVVDNDLVILQVSPQGDLLGSLGFGTSAQDFGSDAFFTNDQVIICGMSDTSVNGDARRGLICKSGINVSCCEKEVLISEVPPPPFPTITDLPFLTSQVPAKQNHTISLSNVQFTEATTCQSFQNIALLPKDTTICLGDTLQIGLITNVIGNIQWSTGATVPAIPVFTPGTYTVSVDGECGTAKDTINVVSIGSKVVADATPMVTLCPNERTTIVASGGINYLWYDDDGNVAYTIANPVIIGTQSTNYEVVVSNGQCRDTASVMVDVLPAPVVSAGQDITIKQGAQARLNTSGGVSYSWTPGTGLSCTDCPDPLADPTVTTTYTVQGIDDNGCSDTASITVVVQEPCPVYVPNVFNPDFTTSTGNENFGVFGRFIALDGYLLRVYSRWGELVFQSKNPEDQWDGTFNSKDAPAGVYLYQLEMNTCDGAVKMRGDITLIR